MVVFLSMLKRLKPKIHAKVQRKITILEKYNNIFNDFIHSFPKFIPFDQSRKYFLAQCGVIAPAWAPDVLTLRKKCRYEREEETEAPLPHRSCRYREDVCEDDMRCPLHGGERGSVQGYDVRDDVLYRGPRMGACSRCCDQSRGDG